MIARYLAWLLIGLTGFAQGVDLLERYPTSLTNGSTSPGNARQWTFTDADLFEVSGFEFHVGEQLKVASGAGDLGIGHCVDGAVWAVLIPRNAGRLTSTASGSEEPVAHIWLRFHPKEIRRLFPPETISARGNKGLMMQVQMIANAKMTSSWQAGGNALIPEPKDMTVDIDTEGGPRRFFVVDTDARSSKYLSAFAGRSVKPPPALTPALAEAAFDLLWESFDQEYAMFVLRPEVDWAKQRNEYRPKAMACRSSQEFAGVCAEMLRPLRDLHVWLTLAGTQVPVFNRPRSSNSNPAAHFAIVGELAGSGRVRWGVTKDKIGYLAINEWSDRETPGRCDEALEKMRDTRALIIDVRLNGGGSEDLAREVAARFLDEEFVYAYGQFRNGPQHTNLTDRFERKVSPRGSWQYDRPVLLLIGEKCMSSNESFIAMMTGATNVTLMGDHTCGSSGNPKIVKLPLDMTVSVPRWIDYLPDGSPLDERGVQPQVWFNPKPGAFEGRNDALLSAALARLAGVRLPKNPIAGPKPDASRDHADSDESDPTRPKVVEVSPSAGGEDVAPLTEIRLRFDRPMDPMSLNLNWKSGGFLDYQDPRYDPQRYEFIIPVRLVAGVVHCVTANEPLLGRTMLKQSRQQFPLEGFQSADHRQACLFEWQFRTQGSIASTQPSPKLVSVSPSSGSTVALLTFVEVKFDQPMMPPNEGLPYLGPQSTTNPLALATMRQPGLITQVEYNPSSYTFRVPLLMPPHDTVRFKVAGHFFELPRILTPNGTVSFSLKGFRNLAGVEAAPIALQYSVAEVEMFGPDRDRIRAGMKDQRLLDVLTDLQAKQVKMRSLAERVQTVHLRGYQGVFRVLESKTASFMMELPGRFYGDVSQDMLTCRVFRIGSDGTNWWFHSEAGDSRQLALCPVDQMQVVDTSIGDPFGLRTNRVARAVAEPRLNYAGATNVAGVDYHLIESWHAEAITGSTFGNFRQWWIDTRTGRISQMLEFGNNGITHTRFLYDAVNEPMRTELFAAPKPEGVNPVGPEILDSTYTSRFVRIRDGADGGMSARWGKLGPKAVYSSGLN